MSEKPEPDISKNPNIFQTREAKTDLAQVRLTGQTRMKIEKVLEEQEKWQLLRKAGFKPRYRLLFHGADGTGKAQPLRAHVLRETGWKKMGEIQRGASVRAPDGTTAEVKAVFDSGEREVWEITLADGRKAECCKEHLWEAHSPGWGRLGSKERITETQLLAKMLGRGQRVFLPIAGEDGKRRGWKPVESISSTGRREKMRCLLIDHPEHLYTTDNGLVTHNTLAAEGIAQYLSRRFHVFNLESLSGTDPDEAMKSVMDGLRMMNEHDDVFLFDEFDAIASHRSATSAGAAARQTSNALLIAFEQIKSNAILICATNFLSTIDPAFRRRFDTICKFDLPDIVEREAILRMSLNRFKMRAPDEDIKEAAKRSEGLSYHETEELALGSAKTAVLRKTTTVNLISEVPAALERRMAFKQLHDT